MTELLNYSATCPYAKIRYQKSNMILHTHIDASYLSAPKARSKAGGFHFFSDLPSDPARAKLNGAVYVLAKILKNVIGSAAETEIGAAYENAKEAIPVRNAAIDTGHPQPSTPMQVDNSMAVGFVNKIIKQKLSKPLTCVFTGFKTEKHKNNSKYTGDPGKGDSQNPRGNLGDYHTKHFTKAHHILCRPMYLHEP